MRYQKERELLVEYGIKMLDRGLTKGSGGNLSIFIRDEKLILISPSGLEYHKTKPEDIVLMDLEGHVVEGDKKPSSEYGMHTIFYKEREDLNAIVHFHSIYASTIASLRWDIPAAYYLIGVGGGRDIRCAKYATFGTTELAQNAFDAMKDRTAVLLANHGLLAGSKDLPNAFNKAEEVELCAEIFYRAKSIGEPVIIEDEEVDKMLTLFKSYGQIKTE